MHGDEHRNDIDGDFWAIVDAMHVPAPSAAVAQPAHDRVTHAQAVADAGALLWTMPLLGC